MIKFFSLVVVFSYKGFHINLIFIFLFLIDFNKKLIEDESDYQLPKHFNRDHKQNVILVGVLKALFLP